MAVSRLSNCSSPVHSTQPEGPAPEEEALHLPAARLAWARRYGQRDQRRGGQVSCQGRAVEIHGSQITREIFLTKPGF